MKSKSEINMRISAQYTELCIGSTGSLLKMNQHIQKNNTAGFTLVELLVVVIIIGLVSIIMSPIFSDLMTAQRTAYDEKHRLNNQLIGASLMSYAANSTQYGRLPLPHTGGGNTKTIYNPAAVTPLTQALTQSGINLAEINGDNTTANKVRVYQLVAGLSQTMPLYFQSGPKVTLTYDYGVIYLTACSKATTICNPNPVTGIPGSTATALNSSNYTTWKTTGTDGPAFFISSMPIQKQMLATTAHRLDKVRESLLSYFRTQQQTAAAGDNTNWYPNQNGQGSSGSMSGILPGSNQQCRDGWYDLSNPAVNILPAVGLSSEEFGKTAWGGSIEYCRDYDAVSSAADTPPHYAAIRINKDVTSGASPMIASPGNNTVLTF